MRLTLRTMLAYLDDVLSPADADEIGKKIRESDFASGLVERIRGVTKKLRMDAPKLDGKGMGNDANTVAEYLDSALPQDRVGDFERVCLESDKHLCEVASCHQILALVLGKAADVPPELRERIYAQAYPETSADRPAGARPSPASPEAKAVAPPPLPSNGRPADPVAPAEVPEYLRSGRQRSLWPLAGAIALTLLLGFVLVALTGPLNSTHPLARLVSGGQPVAINPADDANQPPVPTTPGVPVDNAPDTAQLETPPRTGDVTSPPPDAAAPVAKTPAAPAAPEPPPAESIAAKSPPDGAGKLPAQPAVAVTPAVPEIPEPAAPAPARPAEAALVPKSPLVAAPDRRELVEVGRYTTDGQLLATFNPSDEHWYLKRPTDVLVAGEHLIVLPLYRPQIALPTAVQLTFAGEGSVWMNEPSSADVPRVAIDYGRVLAMTAGKAGAEVILNLSGMQGLLTLADADSAVAIRVARVHPPGFDPEAAPGMPVVELYNANGRATWQPAGGKKVEIPTNHLHFYLGDEPPATQGPYLPPEWIRADSVPLLDREHAQKLERIIELDRPLNIKLEELMKDRRVEVRALSARCLAALGDFNAILRELNDPQQYSYWPVEFDTLRRELTRSVENAAKIRQTLNLLRTADAKDLYRLLWGYSQQELDRGASSQLVRFLEHDQADVRAMAYLNLVRITDVWTLYRPERSPAQQRPAIQNWRDRRDKGQIVYRTPPSALDIYKPMGPPAGEARPAGPAGNGLPMR